MAIPSKDNPDYQKTVDAVSGRARIAAATASAAARTKAEVEGETFLASATRKVLADPSALESLVKEAFARELPDATVIASTLRKLVANKK
jgi:hypothetical protein